MCKSFSVSNYGGEFVDSEWTQISLRHLLNDEENEHVKKSLD